jgi:hypothetical protein
MVKIINSKSGRYATRLETIGPICALQGPADYRRSA